MITDALDLGAYRVVSKPFEVDHTSISSLRRSPSAEGAAKVLHDASDRAARPF